MLPCAFCLGTSFVEHACGHALCSACHLRRAGSDLKIEEIERARELVDRAMATCPLCFAAELLAKPPTTQARISSVEYIVDRVRFDCRRGEIPDRLRVEYPAVRLLYEWLGYFPLFIQFPEILADVLPFRAYTNEKFSGGSYMMELKDALLRGARDAFRILYPPTKEVKSE